MLVKKSKINELDFKKMQEFFQGKKFLFAAWACNNKNFSSLGTHWIPILKKYFKDLIIFDPQEHLYQYGKKQMNQEFIELIKKEKPDYIFFWLIYDEFYINTLFKIKKLLPNTKFINFFGDDDAVFEGFSRFYTLIFDYYIAAPQISKDIYEKEGINNVFYLVVISEENFRPLNLEKKYDVTFIGTPKGDRVDFITYLKNNGVKIKIFGQGWENYPEFKDIYGGQLDNTDFVKVINQSKINLSFTKNHLGELHLNGRIFEIGICNSFGLVEYFSEYLKLFKNNKEMVIFRNKEELLQKINYYLKHEKEREEIAKSAYNRIIQDHTLDKKIRELLLKIFKEQKIPPIKKLPQINKKIIYLSKEDLNRNFKNKIIGVDYICFKDPEIIISSYKDFFQSYSLMKSKKQISCCDYYIYSKKLGDFMTFHSYHSYFVFNSNKKVFNYFLNPGQIMVTKDFFLKNINSFRKMFNHQEQSLITKENTIFVSIPLIKVKEINPIDYENMKKIFYMNFFNDTFSLIKQKKFFYNYYLNLFIISLKGNEFILRYIYERVSIKLRYLLKNFLRKNNLNF